MPLQEAGAPLQEDNTSWVLLNTELAEGQPPY